MLLLIILMTIFSQATAARPKSRGFHVINLMAMNEVNNVEEEMRSESEKEELG